MTPTLVKRLNQLGILPTILGSLPYYFGYKLFEPYGEERLEIGHEVHEAIGKLKDRVSGEVKDLHAEVVGADNVVSCICDFAKRNEVDLIVMGAEGHSRVKDMLIGSVAERVARHAPCSVLLVR